MSLQDYILDRVQPIPQTGCWVWEKSISSNGYGNACFEKRALNAHRLSFEAFKGEIEDGAFVCHTCDVKVCVNPDHLYAGTHAQNMDDVSRGKSHPKRKLSSEEVHAIRSSRAPQREIAVQHGVTQRVVWAIIRGPTYRHD